MNSDNAPGISIVWAPMADAMPSGTMIEPQMDEFVCAAAHRYAPVDTVVSTGRRCLCVSTPRAMRIYKLFGVIEPSPNIVRLESSVWRTPLRGRNHVGHRTDYPIPIAALWPPEQFKRSRHENDTLKRPQDPRLACLVHGRCLPRSDRDRACDCNRIDPHRCAGTTVPHGPAHPRQRAAEGWLLA